MVLHVDIHRRTVSVKISRYVITGLEVSQMSMSYKMMPLSFYMQWLSGFIIQYVMAVIMLLHHARFTDDLRLFRYRELSLGERPIGECRGILISHFFKDTSVSQSTSHLLPPHTFD